VGRIAVQIRYVVKTVRRNRPIRLIALRHLTGSLPIRIRGPLLIDIVRRFDVSTSSRHGSRSVQLS
jgi:hypothetical protein